MPRLSAEYPLASEEPSVLDLQGVQHDLGASVGNAVFLGSTLAASTGDGAVWMLDTDMQRRSLVHGGAILCAAASAEGDALYTGGDDGRIFMTGTDQRSDEIARSPRWIDAVAVSGQGTVAWSSGRQVTIQECGSPGVHFDLASTARSLSFSQHGRRLAIAQYGGILLIDRDTSPPASQLLDWSGSHLVVQWSPDDRFIVSAMLENDLHVWNLTDGAHGRMGGFPARPLSYGWTLDARWLVSSGADCLVLWPFGSAGPIGKSATALQPSASLVSRIACSPDADIIAFGHRDGSIFLLNLSDRQTYLVRKPDSAAITSLVFSDSGERLGFGCDSGLAGLVQIGATLG